MIAIEYFLFGVMVAWTPSLIVLAWALRPTFESETDPNRQWEYLDY